MSSITVKFIGKEYDVPQDILTYIDLLDFTDTIQNQLVSTFMSKLSEKVSEEDSRGLLSDEDFASEIEQQVGKYIAKLCDNGIFNRTINDYLKDNNGYQMYLDANNAALEKMRTLLIQEMDDWQAGHENAANRAESNITGMGFSIWSSSFINHAIYAAMEASTVNKQAKEAEEQYRRDMKNLRSHLDSLYGGAKSDYINNTYIPNMEIALTVLTYELLDKYVTDLIENGSFDGKTLEYVDIDRSNDLLKNLALSDNKQAVIENAFAVCPYNIAVYMQAMKYDLLDYDSFQTAKVFKQDHQVISFFEESWGEENYPSKLDIDYHCVDLWASFTDQSPDELLRKLTEQYARCIVNAYSKVADMINSKASSRNIIENLGEDDILSGESVCGDKAREYVDSIVDEDKWQQLTEQCGHNDLLSRIKEHFSIGEDLKSKADLDKAVTEQLEISFEASRKELAEEIETRRAEEEQQRLEEERRLIEEARIQAEEEERREQEFREQIEKAKKVGRKVIIIVIIAAIIVALAIGAYFLIKHISIESTYDKAIELGEAGKYEKAIDEMESIDPYKESARYINDFEAELVLEKSDKLINQGKYRNLLKQINGLDTKEMTQNIKNSVETVYEYTYALSLIDLDSEDFYGTNYEDSLQEVITALSDVDGYGKSKEILNLIEPLAEYAGEYEGTAVIDRKTYHDAKYTSSAEEETGVISNAGSAIIPCSKGSTTTDDANDYNEDGYDDETGEMLPAEDVKADATGNIYIGIKRVDPDKALKPNNMKAWVCVDVSFETDLEDFTSSYVGEVSKEELSKAKISDPNSKKEFCVFEVTPKKITGTAKNNTVFNLSKKN